MFHTSQWRTDGIGAFLLLNAFLGLAAIPNLPDLDNLAWGEEITQLTPPIKEAANIPSTPNDTMKSIAQKYVETFDLAAGALGIPYKGDAATLPGGTRSSRLVFGSSETKFIIGQCRSKDLSVTSAVHASVAATNAALALVEKKDTRYTSTIRFSLRPYMPRPYSTCQYTSGLYTTGWMKATSSLAFWIDNARAYNKEYR